MSIKHPMLDVFRTPMEDNSIESVEWIPIEPDSFQAGTSLQRLELTHKAIDNFVNGRKNDSNFFYIVLNFCFYPYFP